MMQAATLGVPARLAEELPAPLTQPIELGPTMLELDRRHGWRYLRCGLGWLAYVATWLVDRRLACESYARGGGGLDGWVERARPFLADRQVYHLVRTRTRVDVGVWDVNARVWVFATDTGIALGAWGSSVPGPDALEIQVAFADIASAFYNDITGELLIRLSLSKELPGLRMGPLDAYQIISQIEEGKRADGTA